MVSRTIFIKTNNFRRIRRALLAYVRCGGLALKGLNYRFVAVVVHNPELTAQIEQCEKL